MVLARRTALLLALAVATLGAALVFSLGHSGAAANAAAAHKTVFIDIKDMAYSKSKVTIHVGDKVKWTNRDDVKHDATQSKTGGPKGPLLAKGKSYTWTARKAGTFKYHCSIHPFMTGTIVVKK